MDSAQLLNILGNENRRRILQLLSRRPYYVSEISEQLEVGPKAVIEHLDLLSRAGLVEFYTNNQRRKYCHIAHNIRLEVFVSPHSYEVKSEPVMIDAKERKRLRREYGSTSTLSSFSDELQRLMSLRQELTLAQQSAQAMIEELRDMCAKAIEHIASDYLEAEILQSLMKGAQTTEMLSKESGVPPYEIEKWLYRLEENGVVKKERERWYIN